MRRSLPLRAAACALLVLLGGCNTLRTPYARPDLMVQPTWAHGTAADQAPHADDWWRRLGDQSLDTLVDRVLARDTDLAVAAVNLRKARLQARFAVINPTISASDTYSYTVPLKGPIPASQLNTGTLLTSYEIDLFGALAAQKDVAVWEARATAEDLASTRLSLIGTAIDDYYQIAYLNERIALEDQSVAYAQKTLDLVRAQTKAGAASQLEIASSIQNVAAQQATLRGLTEQLVEARTALNLLLNGESFAEADEPKAMPEGDPPQVDAGLPASLLGRRPDLKAAEMRLREKLASVDQTRLSFYPTLSLTGSVGSTSTSLSQLLQNPAGTLGADIALPFLQWDEVKLNVGVSKANYETAVIQFRQTLYQALTDVENALSARTQYALETQDLVTSLTNARIVERLDEVRYRAGSIPLQTWLDAQETRRQAEASLAQNRLNQLQTYVSLCKALGGDGSGQGAV